MQVSNRNRTEDLARIFKALSDPNRLAILQVLRECCGTQCRLPSDASGNSVSEIAECFDLALSTVSHHLKELKNAGLIHCSKRGQWVYCSPNQDALKQIRDFIGDTSAADHKF